MRQVGFSATCNAIAITENMFHAVMYPAMPQKVEGWSTLSANRNAVFCRETNCEGV